MEAREGRGQTLLIPSYYAAPAVEDASASELSDEEADSEGGELSSDEDDHEGERTTHHMVEGQMDNQVRRDDGRTRSQPAVRGGQVDPSQSIDEDPAPRVISSHSLD